MTIGFNARGVATGVQNVWVGPAAGSNNFGGSNQTAVGFEAGQNLGGSNNTAFGFQALQQQNNGSYNTAIGSGSGFSSTTTAPVGCTVLGALTGLGAGNFNTSIGYSAYNNGLAITPTGNENLILGHNSGTQYVGANRIIFF